MRAGKGERESSNWILNPSIRSRLRRERVCLKRARKGAGVSGYIAGIKGISSGPRARERRFEGIRSGDTQRSEQGRGTWRPRCGGLNRK